MKLLTREELKGIDSSSKTIEKWDEFLKKAVYNLGYTQELIDNMYPYNTGIPMKDGTFMEIPKETGRVFFKMSWADKLCGLLTTVSKNRSSSIGSVIKYMLDIWSIEAIFNEFFPEENYADFMAEWSCITEDIESYLTSYPERLNATDTPVTFNLVKRFINDSDILYNTFATRNYKYTPVTLSDNWKEEFFETFSLRYLHSNSETDKLLPVDDNGILFVYYKPFAERYDAFPKGMIHLDPSSSAQRDRMVYFSEVYTQDYLVISQNPIDKLMCSTKQAFSSCISIAKQDSTSGTNSGPAFGLPALFPSDSIFMVYLTPGKHKNMYWEKEQWNLAPEKRDKDKAYKYLKMTCRAFTYMGTLDSDPGFSYRTIRTRLAGKDIASDMDAIKPEQPRLMVGRQYCAKGEDNAWQPMIEWLLARKGICTSMSFVEEVATFMRKMHSQESNLLREAHETFTRRASEILLREGKLCSDRGVELDRYGFTRGIYFDNVSWDFAREPGTSCIGTMQKVIRTGGRHIVRVGTSRSGSCSVQSFGVASTADMFKVMLGKQSYAQINPSVPVCSHCGEVVSISEAVKDPISGTLYCKKCMEQLGIEQCAHCKELYSTKDPEQRAKHEEINLRELTNPNNFAEFEPNMTCLKNLKKCRTEGGSPRHFICAHCGKIEDLHAYYRTIPVTTTTFKGMTLQVSVCGGCTRKSVMCERCKRLLFLDTCSDALILLPNRKVICPDCIDSIRIKQEKRKALKSVLENATVEDLTEEVPVSEDSLLAKLAKMGIQGDTRTLIKDVTKQVTSYLKAHPEKEFPRLRSQRPLLEGSDSDEVSEENHEIPLSW